MSLSPATAVTNIGLALSTNLLRNALHSIVQNPSTSALAVTIIAATARAPGVHAEVINSAEKKEMLKYTVPEQILSNVLLGLFVGGMIIAAVNCAGAIIISKK